MAGGFNSFFDRWPMATILRVLAVLLFVVDVGLNVTAMIANHVMNNTVYGIGMVLAVLLRNSYQPVVLLGLAELIRDRKASQ